MTSIADRIIRLTRENAELVAARAKIEARAVAAESLLDAVRVVVRGQPDVPAAVSELMAYVRSCETAAKTLESLVTDMVAHGGEIAAFANSITALLRSHPIPVWAVSR